MICSPILGLPHKTPNELWVVRHYMWHKVASNGVHQLLDVRTVMFIEFFWAVTKKQFVFIRLVNEWVEVCRELEIDNGLGLLSNHKAVLQDSTVLFFLLRTVLCIVIQGKKKVLVIVQKKWCRVSGISSITMRHKTVGLMVETNRQPMTDNRGHAVCEKVHVRKMYKYLTTFSH